MSTPGFRPPNWGAQPQLYSMTCTLPGEPTTTVSSSSVETLQGEQVGGTSASEGAVTEQGTAAQITTYYFDATLRADHAQEAVGTEHPVQVGSAIIDHIYLRPMRVTLEVAISDALQSYQSGQYGGSSRSVAAYQAFLKVQAARVPITLATRLNSYQNMWLETVRATETAATFSSFRGVLSFRQIISAQVAQSAISMRPDTTNTTSEGTKGPETIPPDVSNLLDNIPQMGTVFQSQP